MDIETIDSRNREMNSLYYADTLKVVFSTFFIEYSGSKRKKRILQEK
jgi:hypothetical protein